MNLVNYLVPKMGIHQKETYFKLYIKRLFKINSYYA